MNRLSRLVLRPLALLFALAGVAARLAGGTVQVSVKDAKGQPVADAVVSLVALDAPAPAAPKPPADPVVISQQGQEFEPYVTVVVVGTRVSFPNHDKVHHQIYSLSKAKQFEIPLHGPGSEQTLTFDQPGVIAIGCNIHDWMSAYIYVVATPHYLKTSADGLARLADLPPGRYRLEVWHPRLTTEKRLELAVPVGEAPVQSISVVLKPDRRIRRAPEGAGGGYK